jgi:hypothetical protein
MRLGAVQAAATGVIGGVALAAVSLLFNHPSLPRLAGAGAVSAVVIAGYFLMPPRGRIASAVATLVFFELLVGGWLYLLDRRLGAFAVAGVLAAINIVRDWRATA